ncbi:response regulator [Embleya sp. NPDC050154]|uniref:response regulator transcription factor n=1 Tax=unclassified Embleya TaxID=2699296 RepID=UPI002F90C247|nr:response regulator transcription factor [Embleya sp. NBC_00888]
MTKVLVVDDQILIRAGLAALLRAAPGIDVVGEASDGAEAIDLAAKLRPELILMDIRMPEVSGVEATERILAAAEGTPPRIVVLTTFDLDEYVYAALRAGASGFLLKEIGPQRLLAAIDAVMAGDMLFAPSVTRRLIETYVAFASAPTGDVPPDLETLTGRELEVLRLVGTGMANNEIAGTLVVTESTVKTHFNRALAKLNLSSRAQAVVLAYETGLVTPGGRRG